MPGVWFAQHMQTALSSLGDLIRKPLGSAMTLLVIGIALALPAGLLMLLQQVETLSGGWQQTTSISVYLIPEVEDEEALGIAVTLEERPDVAGVSMLTRDDALADFRRYSGFGEILDALESNPLPPVLQVQPWDGLSPEASASLVEFLQTLPQSEMVEYDHQWLERFRTMNAIAQRAAIVLGASLGLAVLLIVGNTIRLEIQSHRPEIEITKLVGGTDGFIRRPFLYRGLWYGLIGGTIAWLLAGSALTVLAGPVAELAGLYDSGFRITAWSLTVLGGLTGTGILLGLGGAWIAVGRHLQAISPS